MPDIEEYRVSSLLRVFICASGIPSVDPPFHMITLSKHNFKLDKVNIISFL